MAAENVSQLVTRINSIVSDASGDVSKDQVARAALLQASRELTTALEQPDEVVSKVAYISGGGNMCVRLAIDLNLFDQLAAAEQALTAEQLAKEKQAEPALVRRIARVLVGMGFAADATATDGTPAFKKTAVTTHMLKPSVKAGIRFLYVAYGTCKTVSEDRLNCNFIQFRSRLPDFSENTCSLSSMRLEASADSDRWTLPVRSRHQ